MSKYAELIEEKNGWGFLSRARVRVVALAVYFFTFLLLYFTLLWDVYIFAGNVYIYYPSEVWNVYNFYIELDFHEYDKSYYIPFCIFLYLSKKVGKVGFEYSRMKLNFLPREI